MRLPLAVAEKEPTSAVALPAPFLIPGTRSQAGGASLPIGLAQGAAVHAGAPFVHDNLRALAVDLVHGVRNSAAASAHGNGSWFLLQHG